MIFFTGDIHGAVDGIAEFITKVHPTMEDVIVLLGDVGANYYNGCKDYLMKQLVTIEVKLPKEVYDSASELLAKQGLTMEDALILFLKETVRLGRIPFDYTEADLEEARRWERIVNDDVQDTGGEETCMVN